MDSQCQQSLLAVDASEPLRKAAEEVRTAAQEALWRRTRDRAEAWIGASVICGRFLSTSGRLSNGDVIHNPPAWGRAAAANWNRMRLRDQSKDVTRDWTGDEIADPRTLTPPGMLDATSTAALYAKAGRLALQGLQELVPEKQKLEALKAYWLDGASGNDAKVLCGFEDRQQVYNLVKDITHKLAAWIGEKLEPHERAELAEMLRRKPFPAAFSR